MVYLTNAESNTSEDRQVGDDVLDIEITPEMEAAGDEFIDAQMEEFWGPDSECVFTAMLKVSPLLRGRFVRIFRTGRQSRPLFLGTIGQ